MPTRQNALRALAGAACAALWLALGGAAQPSGAPDLIVTAIALVPENPAPGEPVTIEATVENVGDADAEGFFNVRLHLSLAPDEVALTFGAPINDFTVAVQRLGRGLRAGARTTVSFAWTVVAVPLVRLRVTADSPLDRIQERNERNNRLEKAFFLDESKLDAWWFDAIEAQAAHALTRGVPEVVVAVVDTGIDWPHPELTQKLWVNPNEVPGNGVDDDGNGFVDDVHGWDFVDGDNNLGGTPRNLHATAVAGIIAADDDGVGTTGVAPGVRVMDLRVLDSQGFGSFSDITAAIVYAVQNGARIINLSLGTPENAADFCNPLVRALCVANLDRLLTDLQAAVDFAVANGVVVVAAAGNEAAGVGFPARFPGAIAVGATARGNGLASYSNTGPQLALSAPGGDLSEQQLIDLFTLSASDFEAVVPQLATLVITPYPGAGYGWFSGTSAAAPFVSGVAALVLSVNPTLSPAQVRALLAASASDLGDPGADARFGAGLVNARRAVEAALGR